MRITFLLIDANLAGGVRVVATHAAGLRERGHDVTVVARKPSRPTLRVRLRRWLRGQRLHDTAGDATYLRDLGLPLHELPADRVPGAADLPDADAIVATWWETAEWIAPLGRAKGAKVYFLQGYEAGLEGQPAERVLATLRQPFHKIAVSRWLAEEIERAAGQRPAVVPNSVDTERICAPARDKQARPTAGFLYASTHNRGCDVVLAALAGLRERVPDLRVVAFGTEPGQELPDWVEYAQQPAQARIPAIYAACDVWLWGSRGEGFGLPLLEALACSTPVVATRAGAAPELLERGGGSVVPVDDVAAMTTEVARVLELDAGEWRELSEVARAIARGYTWSDATGRFEAELMQAVESSPATAAE